MNEPLTRDLIRSLTTDLPVAAAPVGTTIADGRRLRTRRRVVAGLMATAVAAGALGTAGHLLRSDEPKDLIAPAPVPLGHAWWAEGTLHLAGGTLQVPSVRELVQIPGGVVVLTDSGEVRRIDDDLADRLIGHWRSGSPRDDLVPTVRAQDDGKVVWLDGTTSPKHSFVVYDPATEKQVASHSIPTGGFHETAWLNEFEDDVVVWDSGANGQRAWDIVSDEVTRVGTGATFLLALENGLWVTYNRMGDGIEVTSAGRRIWASTDDQGWFSPRGTTLVTISSPPAQLRVRDALTGEETAGAIDLPTGPDSVFLSGDRNLSYVVGTEVPGAIAAPYDLVSCDLESNRCSTIVDDAAQRPVLPAD